MTIAYWIDWCTPYEMGLVVAILVFTYNLRRIINYFKKYKKEVEEIPYKLSQ